MPAFTVTLHLTLEETGFQSGCAVLHSHQQCVRVSVALCSWQYLVLLVFWVFFYFSHSNRCTLVFHCCLNLQFPDDKWWLVSFPVLICYLYIFYNEVSVQIFGPFLNYMVFLLSCFFPFLFYWYLIDIQHFMSSRYTV